MSIETKKHQLLADAFLVKLVQKIGTKKTRHEGRILLVELVQKNWHQIEPELSRWKDILAVPWNRAKNNYVP